MLEEEKVGLVRQCTILSLLEVVRIELKGSCGSRKRQLMEQIPHYEEQWLPVRGLGVGAFSPD